jgi:biopolymer transport protein ExbB/biopolymer transport protein TolQ
MELDLIQLWANMGGLVRAVVVFLTIQALACIAVVIDRIILLYTSGRRSRAFAREAGSALARGEYPRALELAKQHEGSHLASFIATGLGTFLERVRDGHTREKAAQLATRALERKGENLSASLNRGMNVLASVGSTAPFVGLLGTVLGILHAFKLIASEGSGGIGTIGAAIGESLVVTGYGLMIAIPSVLLFNWLSGKIAKYESGLANAGSELVDRLEAGSPAGGAADDEEDEASPAPIPSPA